MKKERSRKVVCVSGKNPGLGQTLKRPNSLPGPTICAANTQALPLRVEEDVVVTPHPPPLKERQRTQDHTLGKNPGHHLRLSCLNINGVIPNVTHRVRM